MFPRSAMWTTVVAVILSLTALDVAPAMAGFTASRTTGMTAIDSQRDADLLTAQRALENKVVAQKLHDYGMTAAETQVKLASLSDRDLHTLASASKGLPSGGDGLTGGLIGALVVVILVIVVLRLTNHDVVVR